MSEHVVTLKLTAVDAGMLEKILAAKTALDNLKNSKVGVELTQDFTKAGTAAKSFGSETVKSSATANSALKSVEQQLGRTRAAALELSKTSASSLNVATRAQQNFANNTVRSGASIVAQNGKVEGSFDRIGQGINRLGRFAGWAAAIGISGATLLGITQAADGFTNLESKLRTITSSEEQLIRTRQNLFDLSQETRQQVESTATLYTRLTRATEQQNLSDQTRLRLTETINKAFVVSGATTAEATNAIIQLSQGLAAGALRGEEFNSVAEQGPIILDLLSKNLGVTRGELRGMAFDGKLTTEVLINGLLSGSQQVDASFAKMAITIGGAGTQVGNAFKVWLGETDKAVGGTQALTSALTALAENFAAVANGVILIAAAFAVKYVAGLVAAQVAQARATAGAIAYTAAQVEGAIAAEAEAAANIVKARAFAGVGGALVSVTAAEQAYAAAQLRTVAATEASILANTKNVGVLGRFGSGLLSLVGGPIGAAILAIGALAIGFNAALDADERRRADFDKSIEQTKDATAATQELTAALLDASKVPPPLSQVESQAATNESEIERVTEQLQKLKDRAAELRASLDQPIFGEAVISAANVYGELTLVEEQISKLEDPFNSLKATSRIVSEEFERTFTPAVYDATTAIEAAIAAGSVTGVFSGLSSSIKQFVEDVRDIRAGDANFQSLFAEIEQGVEKTADKLKKAGKTASELAVEMVEAARASDTYKKADDDKRESMDKTLDAYVRQTRAIEAAEKAKRNDGKAEAEATRRKREAEAALKAYNKAQQDALRTSIEANASMSASAAIQSEYQLALMDTSIAMMAQLKAGADLTVATAAYDAAVQDATRTRDAATRSLKDELQFADKLVASLDDERAMIGLTADERERHEIITRAMAEAQALYNETLEETALLSPQELDAINASITALQSRRKEFDENKNSLEALNRIGGGYVESLSETLVDFFGDSKAGFDDLWDSIADITKKALADLAKQILTSTFFQFLGMGNGSIGNGSFNLASLFGGGGGTGGNGGLSSFMGGGGSASGPQFNFASMSQYAPALAALAGGVFGFSNRGSSNGSAGSLAGAAGYGALGYVGGTVALGGLLGASGAAAGAGVGAAAGGALSGAAGAAAAIPVAGWIIAAIAAIDMITGGKVFGSRYRAESSTSTIGIGQDGGSAALSVSQVRNRSLFQGRQWRSVDMDPGDEAREAALQLFEAIEGTMRDAAERLKIEIPPVIDASIRTVTEYDKKGRVTATKILVDVIGRTWEEATAEAAASRITAESIIATIDAALGGASAAIGDAIVTPIIDGIGDGIGDNVGDRIGQIIAKTVGASDTAAVGGEASSIAERWRDNAEELLEGAQFLLLAATDIQAGTALLGEGGTLTQITDLIEELQVSGETLSATYTRVAAATALLDEALDISGITLDLTREATVRFATEIADAAGGIDRAAQLWATYINRFFTPIERAEYFVQQANDVAVREGNDIGLNAADFSGEDGLARFQALFKEVFATLTPEQVVQYLEFGGALVNASDAVAQLNQLLQEQTDATNSTAQAAADAAQAEQDRVDAEIRARNDALANGLSGLSGMFANPVDNRTAGIRDVNSAFAEFSQALTDTNADIFAHIALENERAAAIARVNEQIDAQINSTLDDIEFDLDLELMSDADAAIAQINRRFDDLRGQLIAQGATTEQLTRLEELRTRTLERQNSVIQQAQQYAQALADGLQLFADAIAELLAKFTGAGMRSLVEEATGLQPVSEQSITGKADAVADIGAQYLLQIGNLNSQLIAAREALGDASPYNTPERTTLEAKIRILQDALGATNSAMAQALDYAAELYQQQIDSILGGLRSEFDVVDPVDAINNRFDELLTRASEYGATQAELDEINYYRAIALANQAQTASENYWQAQLDWIKKLENFRNSLLTDDNLSALTAQERLAESRAQFDATYLAAQAGDVDARAQFEGLARAYLEDLRENYSTGDQYTQGFNEVLERIANLMNLGQVPGTETGPDGTSVPGAGTGPGGTASPTMQLVIPSTDAAIAGLREDHERHTTRLANELKAVKTAVQNVATATQANAAAITKLAERPRV